MALTTGFVYKNRSPLQIPGRDGLLLSYLLDAANFQDSEVNGILVRRGQVLTSLRELAERGDWTEKAVRVSLNHLETAGHITVARACKKANAGANKGRKNGTLITVINYEFLVNSNDTKGEEKAEKRAERVAAYNQMGKTKAKKSIDRSEIYATPASVDKVIAFALEHGRTEEEAKLFFRLHGNGYDGKGNRLTNWQAYFLNWRQPTDNSVESQINRIYGKEK